MINKLTAYYFVLLLALHYMVAVADDSLRTTLEASMLKAHQAIISGDRKAFVSAVDPLNPRSKVTADAWNQARSNERIRRLLLKGAPDLRKTTKFLKINLDGDWAGYYAEDALDDDNYQTLRVYLFHKTDKGWRPTGKSHGLTKAKPGSQRAKQGFAAWKGRAEMLRNIDEHPDFIINNLIGSQ